MTRRTVREEQLHAAVTKRLEWAPDIHAERGVHGVGAVVDEIAVPSAVGRIDDPEVADGVRAVLRRHPELDGEQISVAVHHQVVTLSGPVNSGEQRRAARRAAQSALGVRSVIDELTVPPAPTASQTKARLVEALGPAGAAGAADVDQLDIRLDGHVATLEGNVHSWYERRAAEKAARSVPGVTDVRNRLVVTF